MKTLILLLTLIGLTGCEAVTATEMVSSIAIAEYCKAPEAGRAILRIRVSQILAPNSVQVVCAADKPAIF